MQYRAKPKDDTYLCARLEALAGKHVRWGYRRLYVLIRREGTLVNRKRLQRVYQQAHLQVRPRKKRHVHFKRGTTISPVTRLNQRWCVDFLHDRLLTQRRVRAMHAIDGLSRKNLAIEIDFSINSRYVIVIFESNGNKSTTKSDLTARSVIEPRRSSKTSF
jgi:transposase InsO family protein